MKISYKTDYALKAILDLAVQSDSGKAVSITDIAGRQDIPVPFLEQIMLLLKKAGVVQSKTGKGGGFFLLKKPEEITVGEIVRLIEGPIEPIACGVRGVPSGCAEEGRCAFQEVWLKVADAVSDVVDNATFADIMRRTLELRPPHAEDHYII
ncbi:Rrf2 family transcriptional regulator [bacterium]|nr:Rrf2 family transcriptional regulator [bacterium]